MPRSRIRSTAGVWVRSGHTSVSRASSTAMIWPNNISIRSIARRICDYGLQEME
jgi:hypothetical protein